MTDTVELAGVDWRIGETVGLMPMMRYARAVKRTTQNQRDGVDPDGLDLIEVLDATLELLEQCVHPDDWDKFQRVTTDAGVGQEEYMAFAGQVMAVLADRPTGPRSDSSDGPRTIEPSSTAVSSSPATDRVIDRYTAKGRPDLALVVRKHQEYSKV